jgi:hypothetical protein
MRRWRSLYEILATNLGLSRLLRHARDTSGRDKNRTLCEGTYQEIKIRVHHPPRTNSNESMAPSFSQTERRIIRCKYGTNRKR